MATNPFGEVWLTVEEIVALKDGAGRRKVQLNISSGKWPSRISPVRRLANGKRAREVNVNDLPKRIQEEYVKQLRQEPDPTQASDSDLQTPDLTIEQKVTAALQRLAPAERDAFLEEARRRADIVRRYIALPKKRQIVAASVDIFETSDA